MKKFLEWYTRIYPIDGVSKHRRAATHLLFWIGWGVFGHLGSISEEPLVNRMVISMFVVIQNATIFYSFTYLAIPKLISKEWLQGIILIFFIYFIFCIETYAFYTFSLDWGFFVEKSFLYGYAQNYIKNGIFGVFRQQNFFFEIYMLLSNSILPFLIKFSRVVSQYYIQVEKVSKEKAELEVDFLRTQINPHFFLNALNNIYSQIITKDEAAGDSVVVLSDLMKYILYNSNVAEVSLEKEVRFLRGLVDLEKLKDSRNVKIKFSEEGDFRGYKIAPLILINYVENAFKHGGNSFDKVFLVDIEIKFEKGNFCFRIENDYLDNVQKPSKEGGIGIENTKRRLELLYPDKHSLTIKKENQKHLVEISIKLDKNNTPHLLS